MNKYKRIVVALLVMVLACPVGFISYAEDDITTEESKIILTISTAEEFVIFAQNCTLDDYSSNIKVELTTDIDLTGIDFYDIPIFLGEFDGCGYTISGLSTDLNKDYQGLFRSIEEGASVSNLNVEYSRSTSYSYIGGIAGTNAGTISNCTFSGVISASSYVGGIAAVNTGMIINCSSEGGFFGESQIGGIAGSNEGTILRCENYGEVNTEISNIEFSMEETLNESFLANLGVDTDTTNILDIGGITGNNTGIIQNAVNYADIGYQQVGYNIGGIAGMQSGYITDCENFGDIKGRKEVGGIAGQFEPYISTTYSISKLESLQEELDVLSSLTSEFTANSQTNGASVSDSVTSLGNSIEESQYYVEDLLSQTEGIINENLDTAESISVTIAEAIDDALVIAESLEDVPVLIQDILENADEVVVEVETMIEILEEYEEEFDEIGTLLDEGGDALQASLESFELALDIYAESDNSSSLFDDASEGTEYLRDGIVQLNTAVNCYSDAMDLLDYIYEETEEELDIGLENIIESLKGINEGLNEVTTRLDTTLELTTDLLTKLSESDEVTFTTFDEDYDKSKESLSESLGEVADNIESINTTINTTMSAMLTDFEAINLQLNVVLSLMIDIIEDVSSYTDSDTYVLEDASYENIDEITAGKISECLNYGVVEGDINIGGIAGSISFEYSFDMEDDYKLSSDATQTSSNVGIAVIQSCTNFGDVTSNKDCAGGIVGLQEFGLVTDTISQANVTSVDGNYVGGIVGSSESTIEASYSKCNLSGMQFVGGIVGSGASVLDCYSMSTVESLQGYIGGIAGDLLSNGTILNNYFVSDYLGGLNGVSYSEKAETISYNELIEMEEIPSIFESLTVEFFIEEEVVATKTLNYGDSVVESDFPEIPEIEGSYGVWETFTWDNITADMRVSAEYYTMVTTLASEEKESGLSLVLVEGNYTDEEILVVEVSEDASYTIYVEGEITQIDKVRCLAETEVEVEVKVNDQWTAISSSVDGKYVVFDVDESVIEVRLVEQGTYGYLVIGIVVAVLVLAFFLVVIVKKGKKKTEIE